MSYPRNRAKDGPYEAGRRAGRADRHFLGRSEYDGWDGPGEWTAWYRGWLEGQREAREDEERGGEQMRYLPFYAKSKTGVPKKPIAVDCGMVQVKRSGVVG